MKNYDAFVSAYDDVKKILNWHKNELDNVVASLDSGEYSSDIDKNILVYVRDYEQGAVDALNKVLDIMQDHKLIYLGCVYDR